MVSFWYCGKSFNYANYFHQIYCLFRCHLGSEYGYATRKRKRNEKECQRNVVSTSATADLHTYFLRRSAMKFTFLTKKHQRAAAITGDIFRCRGRHGCSSCRRRTPQLDGVGIGIRIEGGEGEVGIVAIGTVLVIETLRYCQ